MSPEYLPTIQFAGRAGKITICALLLYCLICIFYPNASNAMTLICGLAAGCGAVILIVLNARRSGMFHSPSGTAVVLLYLVACVLLIVCCAAGQISGSVPAVHKYAAPLTGLILCAVLIAAVIIAVSEYHYARKGFRSSAFSFFCPVSVLFPSCFRSVSVLFLSR